MSCKIEATDHALANLVLAVGDAGAALCETLIERLSEERLERLTLASEARHLEVLERVRNIVLGGALGFLLGLFWRLL